MISIKIDNYQNVIVQHFQKFNISRKYFWDAEIFSLEI